MKEKGRPLPHNERTPMGTKADKPCNNWWSSQTPTESTSVCYNCGYSRRSHYKRRISEPEDMDRLMRDAENSRIFVMYGPQVPFFI